MNENEISKIVVESAITVHKEVGPGLLETVYEVILHDELRRRGLGLRVERQVGIPIRFRDREFQEGFRADLWWRRTLFLN